MARTVQSQMLRLALIVSPGGTKKGQKFQDSSAAVTITGAANNGSGLIRITATNHNFVTGNQVYIAGIVGTTEANNTLSNPNWTVTRISSSTFDLQGSTFSNAWVSGGTATGALIGSVDGNFPRQRLLDIYNDARLILANEINRSYPDQMKAGIISGIVSKSTTLQFTGGVATKPAGFIKESLLTDSAGAQITVNPVSAIVRLKDLETSTNRMVFDYGTTFNALTGSTNIPDASTYILYYYQISVYTLSQVLDGTTNESFNDDWCPKIVELAQAIASEAGTQQINALASQLVAGALR